MTLALSNHKKAYQRDRALIYLLDQCKALTTEQIQLLFFPSPRTTQQRLKKLLQYKQVKRDRVCLGEPYYYYLDKRPGQLEHVIGVNWIFIWLSRQIKSWEKFHSFEWEVDYGILRADGFTSIKNFATNVFRHHFVEFDIDESRHPFDKKVRKYVEFYESKKYESLWWSLCATGFPSIIVVTTGNVKKLQENVRKENTAGLNFIIYSLDEIKEACLNVRVC